MKTNIHPNWYENAKVTCACGNTFTIGSTQPEIHIDVCSTCHPFYTGEAKFIDTQGRVEKFQSRQTQVKTPKKKVRTTELKGEEEKPRKTLAEIMAEIKSRPE